MIEHLLVDGDEYLFKATAAVEREIRWDDQNHVLFTNENEAWSLFSEMIERLTTRFEPNHTILTFGSPPYFRTMIDAGYKAGRTRKPLCYKLLREMCETIFVCKTFAGLEADDVLGVLATHPKMAGKCIVVSQDKDMKTLPVTVWDGKDLDTYSVDQANRFHMFQTLTGDKTDGYNGCPGVGEVKAEKLLVEAEEHGRSVGVPAPYWGYVVAAYVKAELTEEDAIKQARLARILRWYDWNNKEKKPILWLP